MTDIEKASLVQEWLMGYFNEFVSLARCSDLVRVLSVSLIEPQPEPQGNDLPAVWDLVIEDIKQRDKFGTGKYGVRLQPFNGRDALVDAYQEALDLVAYLRQEIYQRGSQRLT